MGWQALVNLVGSMHGDGDEGAEPRPGPRGLGPGPPSRAWTRTRASLHLIGGFWFICLKNTQQTCMKSMKHYKTWNALCSSVRVVSHIQFLLLLLADVDVAKWISQCFPPVRVCVKQILLHAYEQIPKRETEKWKKMEAVENRWEDWSQQALLKGIRGKMMGENVSWNRKTKQHGETEKQNSWQRQRS